MDEDGAVVAPGEPAVDGRVRAVLEVLAGGGLTGVAGRWAVDPSVLGRWVAAFVRAGSGAVTNQPDPTAAQQRDRFLAAFAHEMRTPLSVAQGWISMLDDEDLGEAAPLVTRVDEALAKLGERVCDVELLAAASLGRLRLHPETVPVRSVVPPLPDGVDVQGDAVDATVHVDPAHLGRVLRDLWQAAHLDPAPRSVGLAAVITGPWVELRVLRDGDPIEPRVLQALFDPFDLNDDSTGVTIGLYLARALTVAHGGTLGVDQDDDGAVLWVRVPRHSGAASWTDPAPRGTP